MKKIHAPEGGPTGQVVMVDSTESYDRAIEAAATAAAKGDPDSLAQAATLYRKALTAGERGRGPDDLALVPALTGLGSVLLQCGAMDEAAPYLTRAVAIAEQQLGADNPDVVILLNDVSRLYLRHGAHARAEPLLQRLLEMKRAKGEDHPEVATVLASIASVRQAVGRHDEAEQLWRRVLDIRQRTLAPNHIATASALEHLGLSCAARGKIPEALQLLQRALGMREITLGVEHPSLRAVRERIADLQLQASDDLFGNDDLAPAITRPRLSGARHLSSSPTSPFSATAPVVPPAVPVAAPHQHPQRPATARVVEEEAVPAPFVVPSSMALAINEPQQTAPAPQNGVPYLNVLMDIKDELEDTEPAPAPAGGWEAILGTIKVGFRERRTAAIGAVVAVLALPAIGYGVSAMRANRGPEWAQSNSYALVPQASDSTLARASAPDALRPPAIADTQKDTTVATTSSAPASNRIRATESRPSPRPVQPEPESPLLAQRPVVGRLDSIARSISVPSQNLNASFDVRLQSSLASAERSAVAEMTPAVPARRTQLIGSPPAPSYPSQLAKSNIGGDVRVRFEVDTLGRPVIGTFAVIASPHPALSAAVRRVIPTMRFEPAMSPGPIPRPVPETVELSFHFVAVNQN